MKKVLLALTCLVSLLVISCEKAPELPVVQFDKKNYVMSPEEGLTVKVTSDKAVEQDLVIPVSVGGNAVWNEDYTMEDKQFVIKSGQSSAELLLSPKNNMAENLKVVMNLGAGEGYTLGNVPAAEVAISPKEVIIWSFKVSNATIATEYDIEIQLAGKKSGADFVAGSDLKIPFVLTENSTAVAGKQFTVKGDAKEFLVKKGTRSAKITIVAAEGEVPAVAPQFTMKLNPVEENRFEAGVNPEFTLYFAGAFNFADLIGKWAFDSYPLMTDETCDKFLLEMMVADSGDSLDDLPQKNTAEDIFEFKVAGGVNQLVPQLKGDLAKFFRECEIKSVEPIKYHFYYYEKDPNWTCYELTLSKANKLFSSAKEQLEEAKVIISLREDKKVLDVVVRDYIPTDFLKGMYDYADGAIYQFQPELWDQYFLFRKVEK